MNSIPIISQALSVKDYFTKQPSLAIERQHQFTTQAIFVSQAKSLLLYLKGRKFESQITQIQFLSYPNAYIQLFYLIGMVSGPLITSSLIDYLGILMIL
jgi:hypothetical protein